MKLNKRQKQALAFWLGSKLSILWNDPSVIQNFDDFCNGEIIEWRIIYKFGFAGKIWSASDKIYVTGCSQGEISKRGYERQQTDIEQWNKELQHLLTIYA